MNIQEDIFLRLIDFMKFSIGLSGAIYGLHYLMENMPNFRKQTVDDLLKHTYNIGGTGTGKSTKCRNDILNVITQGYGALFIDVHGQDSIELLDEIPPEHVDRVIYINACDIDRPIGISMFEESGNILDKELNVDNIISLFNILWPGYIGASSEDLLRMAGLAVIEQEVKTLLEMYLILTDDSYRKSLTIKDEGVRLFWEETFPQLVKRDKSRLNPPTNKLRKLIMSRVCRLILCQIKPKFNLYKAMEENKIIICNFAKGKLGKEISSLLAGLMICKLELALFKRSKESTPFFVFLDEFQNYTTESFETILSESRKFKVGLNLYHQYMSQLPEYLEKAVLNNVGSFYIFRLTGEADRIAKILGISGEDIKELNNYYYYGKLLKGGRPDTKARLKQAPKPPKKYGHSATIINRSRRLYGADGATVLKEIESRYKHETQEHENVGEIL